MLFFHNFDFVYLSECPVFMSLLWFTKVMIDLFIFAYAAEMVFHSVVCILVCSTQIWARAPDVDWASACQLLWFRWLCGTFRFRFTLFVRHMCAEQQHVDGHHVPRDRIRIPVSSPRRVCARAAHWRRELAVWLWRGNTDSVHEEFAQSKSVTHSSARLPTLLRF